MQTNQQILWKYMRGMRHMIAHEYFVMVFETATKSIPALQEQIKILIGQSNE
ncbi:HepT-like ribonuclease domain-containing protein [Faucicola boevrei]|uniref:HepT-like ribonuclease domain-containing protein n=1 Tax=Faucicola boevrei TaxID=346665 RepID=UPI0003A6D17F|nr:HepT-like ribonuclease domain-containing protein [Moraxella boevrei]